MKTILKIRCGALIFLFAIAAQAQTLTFSNSVVIPGGNPANGTAFDIPQFNPTDGTLSRVTLTLDFSFQTLFNYNGLSASGTLTADQRNSISFVYNGSDVVARKDYGISVFNAGLPSSGHGSGSGIPIETNVVFTAAPDLANFTGTGEIPLSGEYYNAMTVTWTSGTVTWSLDDAATLAALVTYDFTPAPEPGVASLLCLGVLGFGASKHRYWREWMVAGKPLSFFEGCTGTMNRFRLLSFQSIDRRFPLPAGEGRGEGESFERECRAVRGKRPN